MAYFAIGMGLHSEGSYEDVLAQLSDGLSWASGWAQQYPLPSKSAIFQARQRLGSQPLVDLSAGVAKGERAAFPMARVLAVGEFGTHAIFAARVGACTESEASLAHELLPRALQPGMLLTAGRGFFSYALWRTAAATGADLLWRIRTDRSGPTPVHVQDLPDGTWLAQLLRKTLAAERNAESMLVRVIDDTLDDGRDDECARDGAAATVYRLSTTVPDPEHAPAVDLASAYAQRWEIESAFDELETHQRGPKVVLRSKSPELVLQEIWGHLCCHYAIRSLMTQAAEHAGHDPDRISFTAALPIVRHTVAQQGAFPLTSPASTQPRRPCGAPFLTRILARLLPARRRRSAPRAVKRKYTKWHVKPAAHATWPQPHDEPHIHIVAR